MTTASDVEIEVREGTYGEKVIAVEPGGAEFIPLSERHGRNAFAVLLFQDLSVIPMLALLPLLEFLRKKGFVAG